jgi:hypothetical protein
VVFNRPAPTGVADRHPYTTTGVPYLLTSPVCKAWLASSRYQLFRKASVRLVSRKGATEFLKPSDTPGSIACYTRHLEIYSFFQTDPCHHALRFTGFVSITPFGWIKLPCCTSSHRVWHAEFSNPHNDQAILLPSFFCSVSWHRWSPSALATDRSCKRDIGCQTFLCSR